MPEFPGLDLFVYWATERESVRRKREAGEPPPWSGDPIFQRPFCNVERERDRVSIWIREHWREPYQNDPDVWFLMAVARLGGNDPRILAEIAPPLPWDRESYLAQFKTKGLAVGVRGYRSIIGRGIPTHVHLANNVFEPLWKARERIRPRIGDSCRAFFNRLSTFSGLGGSGFLAGQIVADVKFTPALESASDWWDFVTPGPGSQRGLNVVCGRDPEADWSDDQWHRTFARLRSIAGPQIEEMLGRRLSASDLQNCCCEFSKYAKAKTTGEITRRFKPYAPVPAALAPSTPVEAPAAPALVETPVPATIVSHAKFKWLARRFVVPATGESAGLRLVVDVEANGLLDTATTIHCIVIADLDSDQIDGYGPDQIPAALDRLARADCLVGHNIAGYDLPLLRRLYDWAPAPECTVMDTLIAGRLILPNVGDLDDKAATMGDSSLGKLRGRYSIEAWGARLGMPKIGADIEDWSAWTPRLQERCAGDVTICKALYRFLQPDGYNKQAMELEHRTAAICAELTAAGVPFDANAAEQLRQQWTARRAELDAQLSQQFPGAKLSSRKQIGALLEARGWVPENRTAKTKQPKIDDELLEAIPAVYPEFTGLAEHYTLGRRLGQLANGNKSWLKHIGEDGRIHGAIVHIGTPHSRAAHFNPNLAQVPNPKKGKPLASECRSLFRHPGDWVFVACDQAGLQDRCFSHYLAAFDGGEYGRSYVAGVDPHWASAIALNLVSSDTECDKANKLHSALREGAKSFRYGFLFGMRAKRAGEIIATTIRTARQVDSAYRGPPTNGGEALRRFEAATPGLRQLRQSLETQAARNEWVAGLDGRRVPTDAQYKALNRIVTSAEAIICKRWLIRVYDELHARFRYGWDGDVVITAWIHDELACCCRPEIAEQVGAIMVRHAKEPGGFYDLKVPLDAGYTIGHSWAGDAQSKTLNGVKISDALLEGRPDSGASEITHQRPAVAVEPEADHCAAVEDSENSGDSGAGTDDGIPSAPTVDDAVTTVSPAPPAAISIPKQDDAPETLEQRLARIPLPALIGKPLTDGKILCPFHGDKRRPNLHIYNDHFHCFGCGCGAHGDHVDWLMMIEGMTRDEALRVLAEWDGPVVKPQIAAAADRRTLASALRIWNAAKPITSTPAIRYLAEVRQIDVDALPTDDAALRFHPRCVFGAGISAPCLIACYRDVATDEFAGIHRIALTEDVFAGAKVQRLTLGRWPSPRARAIKFWPSGEQLFLGEGVETVLAAATRLPYDGAPMRPAWAAGPGGGISRIPPVPGVKELVLLIDHDASGGGEKFANDCRQLWRAAGRKVTRLRPQRVGADFNDLVIEQYRTVAP